LFCGCYQKSHFNRSINSAPTPSAVAWANQSICVGVPALTSNTSTKTIDAYVRRRNTYATWEASRYYERATGSCLPKSCRSPRLLAGEKNISPSRSDVFSQKCLQNPVFLVNGCNEAFDNCGDAERKPIGCFCRSQLFITGVRRIAKVFQLFAERLGGTPPAAAAPVPAAALTAAKAGRNKQEGLGTRRLGHAASRGKRTQARRDTRSR